MKNNDLASKGLKDFKSSFGSFVANRASEIADELLENNIEYKEVNDKLNKLFHQIEGFLPEEHRCLMFDYESFWVLQVAIIQDIMYEQGLKDGCKLMYL